MEDYEILKLENQLCFPLYAAAKGVVNKYRPYLDELGLTYTQYITLMALWERRSLSVTELGKMLFLDSGTLTPVLKSLEKKGLVKRTRSQSDERVVVAELTEEGDRLKERAVSIPQKMAGCINLTSQETGELFRLLY